jgi:hypothetical protein
MGSISGKSCRENKNIILGSKKFFLEKDPVYEVMWKNSVV